MIRNIFKSSIFAIAVLFVSSLAGCAENNSATVVTPSGDVITIEVALSAEKQAQGLMFRESLAENSGMLFVFDQERPLSFWMKNTLIPLDVLYLDEKSVIVDIQTMTPCPQEAQRCPGCLQEAQQCPGYPAKADAKYALEINAGKAEKLGLKIGDTLKLTIPSNDQSSTK